MKKEEVQIAHSHEIEPGPKIILKGARQTMAFDRIYQDMKAEKAQAIDEHIKMLNDYLKLKTRDFRVIKAIALSIADLSNQFLEIGNPSK